MGRGVISFVIAGALSACVYGSERATLGKLTHLADTRLEVFAAHGGRSTSNHRVLLGDDVIGEEVTYCTGGSAGHLEGDLSPPAGPLAQVGIRLPDRRYVFRAIDPTKGTWLEGGWHVAETSGNGLATSFCCGAEVMVWTADDERVVERLVRDGDEVRRDAIRFRPPLGPGEQKQAYRVARCHAGGTVAVATAHGAVPGRFPFPRFSLWVWPRTSPLPVSLGLHDAPPACAGIDGDRMRVTLTSTGAHVELFGNGVADTPCGTLDLTR